MKNILLHLGHEKTGSSFIQSSLDKSISGLAESGIYYPIPTSAKTAPDALIRTGNIGKDNLFYACQKFIKTKNSSLETLLLSSESLFPHFANDERFFEFSGKLDAQIKILLFIRNPLDLAFSSYGQKIKRGGYSGEFDEFIIQFDFLDQIFRFYEFAEKHAVPIDFVNYSKVKKCVLSTFEGLINIPLGTLKMTDVEVINRSLSDVEIYIQSKFNEKYGREARKFISDPLCEKLTDIKRSLPKLSEKNFHIFRENINPQILKFNTQYARSDLQKYDFISDDDYIGMINPESEVSNFAISSDQLDVLIGALHQELINPFSSIKRFIKWKRRANS